MMGFKCALACWKALKFILFLNLLLLLALLCFLGAYECRCEICLQCKQIFY